MNRSLLVTLSEEELRDLIQRAVREELASAFARLHEQRPTDPLLTRTELADHLHCSRNHVAALLRRGMPSFQLGADKRFRAKDVETWLAELRHRPAPAKKTKE